LDPNEVAESIRR